MRKYACSCGDSYFPTKGTIFYQSKLSLKKWFYAIYLISQARNGISSHELARHLSVPPCTAHKIGLRIRAVMGFQGRKLRGKIELDETYHGGAKRGKRGRGASGKTPIFGMVERGGRAKLKVTPNVRKGTLMEQITENVHSHSILHTDEFKPYSTLNRKYRHKVINHSRKVYVEGDVHTNTIEGLWSHLKRGIQGTHVTVSSKHLQNYANHYEFMWNARLEAKHPFWLILERAVDLDKKV